jgi:hypothetical protein
MIRNTHLLCHKGERGEEERVSAIADEFVRGRGVIDAHARRLEPAQRP